MTDSDYALLALLLMSAWIIKQLKGIRMKLSEALTALTGLEASLDEASTEILGELEKLRTSDPDLSPEGQATVERLVSKGKALADIIPNA